jgi:hypothetical protein
MVHELDRLFPALVLEEHEGPVAFLPELPVYLGADPFLRALDDFPEDAAVGIERENLHVEAAAIAEAELQRAADLVFRLRAVGPPFGQSVARGQCLVDVIGR